MFRNTFQNGVLSVFYAIGSHPLQLWHKKVGKKGLAGMVNDDDIQSVAYELRCTDANLSDTYLTCPYADPKKTLGIKLQYLTFVVKNLDRYFTLEVQIIDNKGALKRIRTSNYQAKTRRQEYICTIPLQLDGGWNQIVLDLADLTKRAYGTEYVETARIQVHANTRIRRIYFCDKTYSEEDLPPELKLYKP
mmetsp:Transcript_21403/g.23909  ORF Transcript_21403/g.23909 Transcript_21403/m.23909 type:complete len:191 (+) Transcript_21403:72-644(+)